MQAAPETSPKPRPNPWPWVALVASLAWVVLVRVPLVLNATNHLDSDLAVDGLTLLDATNGHWRWHYPGTPYIGSLPVLLSMPMAIVRGPDPIALVSGGVVGYLCVVLATFWLNRRVFGPSVAAWGLVPMAFASTGTVWLSGRVTGGHLLAVAWHAGAFALLSDAVSKGGWRRSAILGLWCGLGLWIDTMFAVTWVGLVLAAILGWWSSRRTPRLFARGVACVLAFALAAGLGIGPRFVGRWVDPHDSYREQFDPVTRPEVLKEHARILAVDCLPRLVAGHRLPGLQAEAGGLISGTDKGGKWLATGVSVVAISLFALSLAALAIDWGSTDPSRLAVRVGLIVSSAAVLVGFIVIRNIENSDNYRYLVFLLVPWSTGFGLLVRRPAWVAIAVVFAGLMTLDTAQWYQRLGWIDGSWRPTQKVTADPPLTWLREHPETVAIFGDYWDAYRLSYLTGGKVMGVPFPEYPDRFPEVARALPGGRPRTLIVGPSDVAPRYRARALSEGAREIHREPGLSVVDWPVRVRP